MTGEETPQERSTRILDQLKARYPGAKAFDLDGCGQHFVCEVDPTSEHPEYDLAVEVILSSKAHKHLKTVQYYKILTGTLLVYINEQTFKLEPGDRQTIPPDTVHWATSDDECWVEIRSEPGWTVEDHILV